MHFACTNTTFPSSSSSLPVPYLPSAPTNPQLYFPPNSRCALVPLRLPSPTGGGCIGGSASSLSSPGGAEGAANSHRSSDGFLMDREAMFGGRILAGGGNIGDEEGTYLGLGITLRG